LATIMDPDHTGPGARHRAGAPTPPLGLFQQPAGEAQLALET